ncbi:MAG: DUF2608 domain-containing protein [Parachlamydiaceae bacterium]
MVRIFFAFLLAASAFIEGAIVEVHNFNQIEDYVTPNTLIVFDIDNTLMQLKQQLGSDEWFYHRMNHYTQESKSPTDALELALNEWESIQHLASVDPVESETAALVRSLQERFSAIGLTTRGLGLATRTIQQLNSIDINLALHPISSDEIHFMVSNEGILYRKGILFTAGRHKGECLRLLLESADFQPERVLFINDKKSHILPVESFCESHGIEFIGLRYGFLDEKVNNYNPDIAEVQWQHFGKILSDSEATLLLDLDG